MDLRPLYADIKDVSLIDATRVKIIAVISEELARLNTTLDDWQKIQFANAIGALSMNVYALDQPTTAWLRLCLVDLEKTMYTSDAVKGIKLQYSAAPDYDELVVALQDAVTQLTGSGRLPSQ